MQLQHSQKHRRRTCERQGASAGIRSSGSGHFPRVKREYGSGERASEARIKSFENSEKRVRKGKETLQRRRQRLGTKNDCGEEKTPTDYEEVRAKSSLARRRMLLSRKLAHVRRSRRIRVVGFRRVSEASPDQFIAIELSGVQERLARFGFSDSCKDGNAFSLFPRQGDLRSRWEGSRSAP